MCIDSSSYVGSKVETNGTKVFRLNNLISGMHDKLGFVMKRGKESISAKFLLKSVVLVASKK